MGSRHAPRTSAMTRRARRSPPRCPGPSGMVVQSAAVPPAGPLATIAPEVLGRSVSLKLGGLLRLIRAVEDRFSQGSRIVAIGGVFGSQPTPQTCGAGVTNA